MRCLDGISGPADLKKLGEEELPALSSEIREILIEKLSAHGGHIGPNLGMVEATVALHYVFDSPKDRIVFDVSHQSYAHKILTGRARAFYDPAHYGDVSGYTNPAESEHDSFLIGHTSTSLSLAAGLAKGRDLLGGHENIIAVIGDGSLSGGEALEGLSVAADLGSNFIVVVNDNEMSIAENHGGIYKNLKALRDSNGEEPCNLFRSFGFDYRYVANGNDVLALVRAFRAVKDTPRPTVVHIHTKKGKGLPFAENDPEPYHAGGPFDRETGEYRYTPSGKDYGDLVRDFLLAKMKEDPSVIAVNAATPGVFGFDRAAREEAGAQFLDVGIAEETAAAISSGLAKRGATPVWGVFSTFMQRTYDQLMHDICINGNPVTVLNFGAGTPSMRDIGHLGYYDIPMTAGIPGLLCLAPTNAEEMLAMLDWSMTKKPGPVMIRVPCGKTEHAGGAVRTDYGDTNRFNILQSGRGVAILAVGHMMRLGEELARAVKEKTGVAPTLIDPVFLSGIDGEGLDRVALTHGTFVTIEDGILDGGYGERIARHFSKTATRVFCYGLSKVFRDGYDVNEVFRENRMTKEQILADILA